MKNCSLMGVLAIDFGTSRIKAAYWDEERREAVLLPLGKGGRLYVPSLFHVAKDGRIRFGDEAEMMLHHDPLGVLENLKLKLDKPIQYGSNGVTAKSAELMSLLFGRLIEYAAREAKPFAGQAPEKLVLTLPSRWDYGDIYRDALDTAGYSGEVVFLREPEAAAWAWIAESEWSTGDVLVVLDFGGGTVDWATVQVDEHGRPVMIPELPPGGITAAGAHVDEGLFDEMMSRLSDMERKYALQHRSFLMDQIRQMKESQNGRSSLSGAGGEILEIMLGPDMFRFEKPVFEDVVKREAIDQALEGIGGYVKKVIRYAKNVGKTQMACVLVGGTRMLARLEEQVKAQVQEIGKSENVQVNFAVLAQADFATVRGCVCKFYPEPQETKKDRAVIACEEQTEFDVVLIAAGESKINVIKVVRAITDLGLKEAKDLVDGAPKTVKEAVSKGEAEKFQKELKDAGASVELIDRCVSPHSEDVRNVFNAKDIYRQPEALQESYNAGRIPHREEDLLEYYRRTAEQGNAASQYNLGVMYMNGQGVSQNYQEAVKWYRLAADQGDASAQNNLGVMYYNGEGVSQNYQEAVKWYRLAADQGMAQAQFSLGVMYYIGEGVSQNYQEAVKWYRLAADQGMAQAQFILGVMYMNGQGVSQNYQEAVKWYRLAADQGIALAQYNLGVMYMNGQGVSQNYQKAVKWYRLAADQGMAQAQFSLGVMYDLGQGVSQDYMEAAKWFRLAAKQGYASAQFNLGLMYAEGQGVSQSYQGAVTWYRRAADQGHSGAQFSLGVMYDLGRGISLSAGEAVKWYRKAADQGFASAQHNLGVMYYTGSGVSQGYAEAAKWFRLATKQGNKKSEATLEVMYRKGLAFRFKE